MVIEQCCARDNNIKELPCHNIGDIILVGRISHYYIILSIVITVEIILEAELIPTEPILVMQGRQHGSN